MESEKKERIGHILVEANVISKEQLDRALRIQEDSPYKLLGEILIEEGSATQDEVLMAYGLQNGLRCVNLDDYDIPLNVIERIPVRFACKFVIMPLKEDHTTLTLCTCYPIHATRTILTDFQLFLDKTVDLVVAGKTQMIDNICRYYNISEEQFESFKSEPVHTTKLSSLDDLRRQDTAIIRNSKAMSDLYSSVLKFSKSSATVLLLGETGTGKELFANAVHQNSLRRDKPFIKVNCAAIPETLLESELFGHEKGAFTGAISRRQGRFERANGGTLFLDEIGEIPVSIQTKLLRVLQDGSYERLGGTETFHGDVRIIAATNRNLEAEVKACRFREDLFYRLNVIPIKIPPLRDHKEDIPYLIENFIKKYNKKNNKQVKYVSPKVLDILHQYDWPGNIRELENCVERMVLEAPSDDILAEHVPYHLKSLTLQHAYHGIGSVPPSDGGSADQKPAEGGTAPDAAARETNIQNVHISTSVPKMDKMERDVILAALNQTRWNKVKAAEVLGIHRNTLSKKIKEFGI